MKTFIALHNAKHNIIPLIRKRDYLLSIGELLDINSLELLIFYKKFINENN